MAIPRPWIRLYTEVPDDPKVQGISATLFRFWINCLCLAGRNEGCLPPDEQISWCLREQLPTVSKMKRQLVEMKLLDETLDGGFTPHGWNDRQYETDVSSNRVKRFRERQKKRSETVSGNVSASALSEVVNNNNTSLPEKNPENSPPADWSLEEPCAWFTDLWPGPIPENFWRVFGEKVNTPERLEALRKNAPLWAKTKKYRDGFTDASVFIRSGVWLHPPKRELLAEACASPGGHDEPEYPKSMM